MKFHSILILLAAMALFVAPLGAARKKKSPPATPPAKKPTEKPAEAKPEVKGADLEAFYYVGQWRGKQKGKKSFGVGTVSLIAPSWAITAHHVATKKISSPETTNASVTFQIPGKGRRKSVTVGVKKAYGGFKGDFALLHLSKPVTTVAQVALLADSIVRSDGTIPFTMVGHKGGLHVHRGRTGRSNKDGTGFYHNADPDGNRPGKAGDSGGAWVIEREGKLRDVQFAVIHGGGKGPQIAPNRKLINEIVARETPKETVEWVRKKDLVKSKSKPAVKPPAKKRRSR